MMVSGKRHKKKRRKEKERKREEEGGVCRKFYVKIRGDET
jgi:hypothetical protein